MTTAAEVFEAIGGPEFPGRLAAYLAARHGDLEFADLGNRYASDVAFTVEAAPDALPGEVAASAEFTETQPANGCALPPTRRAKMHLAVELDPAAQTIRPRLIWEDGFGGDAY